MQVSTRRITVCGLMVSAAISLMACDVPTKATQDAATATAAYAASSPFAQISSLPYNLPPFDKIKDSDYQPSFEAGMAQQRQEVSAIAATFDRVNSAAASATSSAFDKATSIHLAGDYQLNGNLDLNLGYRNYKKTLASNAPDLRSDFFWGGASYKVTPVVTLIGAIYYQNIKNVASGKDADPIMYSVRGKYALSKRTDLYLSAAYAKAKNQQLVGLSRDDIAYGSSQTGVIGGIQHRF